MSLSATQIRTHIRQQKLQQESQKSPLPSRFSFSNDRRLRNPLDANQITNKAMNIDGSVTPVLFEFRPGPTEIFIVEYISLLVIDPGTFLATEFGSLGIALTNGLLVRGQQDGAPHEITNLTTNADILQCFGGSLGSTGVGSGSNQGVFGTSDWLGGRYELRDEFVLFGDKDDFILIEVRDDLSDANFVQSSFRRKSIES